MKSIVKPVDNEDGMALVIALMVLTVLTFLGIAALQETNVEMEIVRNSAEYRQNFYQAEAATMEVSQVMENEADPKNELNPNLTIAHIAWLKNPVTDMRIPGNWVSDDPIPVNNNSAPAVNLPQNTRYAVHALGIAGGASLAMGATNLYAFNVYGMYQQTAGRGVGLSLLEVGYRKRF